MSIPDFGMGNAAEIAHPPLGIRMLLLYLMLVVTGVIVTVALRGRGLKHRVMAVIGTLLGVLAVLTGFSIGPIVAMASMAALLIAATGFATKPVSTE